MIDFAIEILATILGIAGILFINFSKIQGYYCWVISNSLFIYIAMQNNLYGQSVLWVIYIITSLHGIHMWRSKDA